MISRAGLYFLLTLTLVLTHVPSIGVHARLVRRTRFAARESTIPSGFSPASWIWFPDPIDSLKAPAGNVAFLKTFTSAPGKTGANAVVSMTAADPFTLWVNGQPIGAANGTDDWKFAHVFRAALNTSTNVFSVLAASTTDSAAPAPGLLVAVEITYTDNTTDSFVSDSSWRAAADIPADFPMPLNSSAFTSAAVLAPYGSGPWPSTVMPAPAVAPLDLSASTWIWSTLNSSSASTPVGKTGFRKTVSTPSGKSAAYAQLLLTVDDTFDLYVNGRYVGSPPYDPNVAGTLSLWNYAQQFTVSLDPDVNVFSVVANNLASSAGFIAAIRIFHADNTSDLIGTDSTWLAGNITDVSTFLSAADTELALSIIQGAFGMAPWGQLLGISDALDAARVPASPYTSTASQSVSEGDTPDSGEHKIPVWALIASAMAAVIAIGLLLIFWMDIRRKRREPPSPLPLPPPPILGKLEREIDLL
ncbi:hypothetical protein DFH09DRAFT_258588 [Mycena vulgaris]|nr:hypothetical protein DFH09DRAFT_258588 [Mycena vulgaris]